MSGSTFVLIYVAVLTSLSASLPSLAFAGQWDKKCKQAADKSKAECEKEVAEVKSKEGVRSSVPGSDDIQNNSKRLQSDSTAQAADLTKAKNSCEKSKKECEEKCKQAKDEAQPISKKDPKTEPRQPEAAGDVGKIDSTKQEACIAPIMLMMGQLGSGAGDAAKAAGDSGKTGGASGGMPMPMPMPGGGGDKKEDAAKGDPAVTPAINCDTEGYSKYSDCNTHYISKCEGAMNSAPCEPFINRYCGAYTPTQPTPKPGNDSLSLSAQSTTAAAAAATANLVADKQGEGLGSAFCQKVTAYRFCQMAGRSQCPSCKNQNSAWASNNNAGQLADAQKTCPTDPIFLDPAVLAQVNGATGLGTSAPATGGVSAQPADRMSSLATGSGASGTGGGAMGGGAGGAGSTANNPNGGVAEGRGYTGPSLSDGAGYGGGGGGSYDGSASGPGYDPASVNGQARRAPAATLAAQGGPKDVAVQYGPSVFSIQSTTYRDMCAKGRFLHCRR